MIICKSLTSPFVSSVSTRAFMHMQSYSLLFRNLCSASQAQPQQTLTGTSREFKHASLQDRAVIRITGKDASQFLQGIITNDIGQLQGNETTSRRCMYTFMLNTTGRIFADMFVYSLRGGTEEFFLELDTKMSLAIGQLLKRYKIRRKISVVPEANCRVTAVYPDTPETMENLPINNAITESQLIVQDPRNHHFGYRVLSLQSSDPSSILNPDNEYFNGATLKLSYANDYRRFRYRLGFGEGALDFPPEAVFPFEANAELLNAVSFSKGCYIGQELTARTYHTGVVRKRLLPIELLVDDTADLADTLPVQNVVRAEVADDNNDAPKKIMGRFRVNFGRAGLATLKHDELFNEATNSECTNLKLDKAGYQLRAWRPFWWPEEIIQQFNQKF